MLVAVVVEADMYIYKIYQYPLVIILLMWVAGELLVLMVLHLLVGVVMVLIHQLQGQSIILLLEEEVVQVVRHLMV